MVSLVPWMDFREMVGHKAMAGLALEPVQVGGV